MSDKKDPVLEICLKCFQLTGQNICPDYSNDFLENEIRRRQIGMRLVIDNQKTKEGNMEIAEKSEGKKRDCSCGSDCPGKNGGECGCEKNGEEKPSEDEDERVYIGCA